MADSDVSSMCMVQLQLSVCGGVGAPLMIIGVFSREGVGEVLSVLSVYQICNLVVDAPRKGWDVEV
jgi:hypothetical protein